MWDIDEVLTYAGPAAANGRVSYGKLRSTFA